MFVEHEKRDPGINRESSHPVLDEASKLLLGAAALIEKHGLATNGDLRDAKGRLCTWGAIAFAHGGSEFGDWSRDEREAMRRMSAALGGNAQYGEPMVVCNWNNKNSAETVVAKLRAVALGG